MSGSHKWRWIALGVVALIAIALFFKADDWHGQLRAGSGYNAAVVCMCRYQGNRSLESCEKDMQNIASLIRVSEDAEAREIHAGVPLIAGATARYDPEFGCVLR